MSALRSLRGRPEATLEEHETRLRRLRRRETRRQAWRKSLRAARSLLCVLWHGGHELYVAHKEDKICQQCLLCGHETKGWEIDRRDRRRLTFDKKRR